jgi:hypothetical protein
MRGGHRGHDERRPDHQHRTRENREAEWSAALLLHRLPAPAGIAFHESSQASRTGAGSAAYAFFTPPRRFLTSFSRPRPG